MHCVAWMLLIMPSALDKKVSGLLNMFRVAPQSWVMLDKDKTFVPLPKEKVLFTSPSRTTLTLQTPNLYPGKTPLHISSNGGVAFLTNQRVLQLARPTSVLFANGTVSWYTYRPRLIPRWNRSWHRF